MRKFLSHLPSIFFRCCPIHIFYTIIVLFDLVKAIVSLFYLISSIALPTNPAQRIHFLVPIIALVIFETTSACFSRWKGYIYNNSKLHMCYIISRILFIVGVIPLVTIGAGLGCKAQDSEAGMRCYQGLLSGNAVWLTIELWFTYIVFKIYRKTVDGDYVIYGRPAVLGRSLDPLPFQSTEDAPAVEVRGVRIIEEDKGKDKIMKLTTLASEGDIPINIERDLEKCEEKEVLDAIPVSIPIKKNLKKTKKVLNGEIEIVVGDKNKAIKLEQVDLTSLVKK